MRKKKLDELNGKWSSRIITTQENFPTSNAIKKKNQTLDCWRDPKDRPSKILDEKAKLSKEFAHLSMEEQQDMELRLKALRILDLQKKKLIDDQKNKIRDNFLKIG
jgi:hypothetical protein